MKPQWLLPLGVCLLVNLGGCAYLPSHFHDDKVFVVKRSVESVSSDKPEQITPIPSSTTEAPITTEEPSPPLKLTEMDVRSEVAMRYARTAIVTRVRNPARKSQETTFRVLLPETAFISGFTMTLDGKSYKAYVKEKEEAKQIYETAVSQGIGAAHVATKARDSNHFTVSVNVEPNTTAVFNLTYEELLTRRNKVYNHAINLHPGALVPKLTVTVHIKETEKITSLRVPEVRTGNEIDATEGDPQNSKAVIERGHDDREATITFKPDLEEQQRLKTIYSIKSKESQAHQNTWYRGGEDKVEEAEGVLGQFVVQYDVERPESGEMLVNDGYFVHFFAPSNLPPLNKHVVFVLDTSGSMMDRKINQLKQAMQTILDELNPGDYFNIVEFDSIVRVHNLKEADEEPTTEVYNYYNFNYEAPVRLQPAAPATKDNVAKAKVIISRLIATGGTNIAGALDVAVQLIHKGINQSVYDVIPENRFEETTVLSKPTTEVVDIPVAESSKAEKPKAETPKDEKPKAETPKESNETPKAATEVQSLNEDEKVNDDVTKLEPIVIFLTDGDPTTGEVNPTKIINRLTEKNSGPKQASIFSLAFGEDADRSFLRKLSLRNAGFMRHIYEAADAALQLRDFYRQVSSPLLADVKFVYPPNQMKEVTKSKFRTFYSGSEAVVAGRIADKNWPHDDQTAVPTLIAVCGVDDGNTRKRFEATPKIKSVEGYLPLERLWAYLTIKQLLDERDAADNKDDKADNSPGKKALEIALKYEFVTPLTSLVVVKPNKTDAAVNAESVDQPNAAAGGYGVPLAASGFSASYPMLAFSAPLYSQLPAQPLLDVAEISEEEEDYDGAGAAGASGLAGLPGLSGPPMYYPNKHFYDSMPMPVYTESLSAPPALTIPAQYPSTTNISVTSTTPAPSVYGWLQTLRKPDSDVIAFQLDNKTIELELVKEGSKDIPKDVDGDKECAHATDGAAGVCVYVTRCGAAPSLTVSEYSLSYCQINNKYAGVCCPKSQVDATPTTPPPASSEAPPTPTP